MIKIFKAIAAGLNVFILLPAILYNFGQEKLANAMYFMLGFVCHQRPDRSFYLFGQAIVYPKDYIWERIPFDQIFTLRFGDRFVCNDEIGCKFGVCARCTGIYVGLLVGLFVSEFCIRYKIPKIIPILMLFPLILDGGIQTFAYILSPENGFYESTNTRRLITGLFFGLAMGYFTVSALKSDIAKPLLS